MKLWSPQSLLLCWVIFGWSALTQAEVTGKMTCERAHDPEITPSDCDKALLTGFFSSVDVGYFHRFDPKYPERRDLFTLPNVANAGDCSIVIEMDGAEPIKGSWLQLWTLTSTLSRACQSQYARYNGGTVHAGPGNRLKIRITQARRNLQANNTEPTNPGEVASA
ncbi:MAG: hypothetical protein Q9224_002508 [Gallowayella concinna]